MHIPVTGLIKADLHLERVYRGRVNREDIVIDGVNYAARTVMYDRFWSEQPARIGTPNMWDGEYRFHVVDVSELDTVPMVFNLGDLPCMGSDARNTESELTDVSDADDTDND